MPYVEKTLDARTEEDEGLLAELIRELRSPRERGQPFIEVRNMSRRGFRHVYVIWDRWKECRPEVRASIIRDAFAAVKGHEYEQSIAVTVAATVPEAAEAGLLPLEVKPRKWYQLQGEQLKRVREAMIEEGGSVLGSSLLPSLRFADDRQAEEAAERLKQRVSELDWGVVITRILPEEYGGLQG
jgi:hypothetical protein